MQHKQPLRARQLAPFAVLSIKSAFHTLADEAVTAAEEEVREALKDPTKPENIEVFMKYCTILKLTCGIHRGPAVCRSKRGICTLYKWALDGAAREKAKASSSGSGSKSSDSLILKNPKQLIRK